MISVSSSQIRIRKVVAAPFLGDVFIIAYCDFFFKFGVGFGSVVCLRLRFVGGEKIAFAHRNSKRVSDL